MIALLAQEQTGSPLGLLLPVLLFGAVFYFLMYRPQKARQRQQQALMQALEVGDEVMTAGGIFGTVTAIDEDDDVVTVEVAPGTRIRMLRRAIAQRLVDDADVEPVDDVDDDLPDEGAGSRP